MALFLDLAPTVEARLIAEAHLRDMSASEFVKMLLTSHEERQEPENANARQGPETIINKAVAEMKEHQIANRELVVEVITHKNNLHAEVSKEDRLIAEFERKATKALREGNRDLARQFFKESVLHRRLLEQMEKHLTAAVEAADKVKEAIRQEEERIRLRYAEALAKQSSRKQAKLLDQVDALVEQYPGPSVFTDEKENWDQRFEEWAATQTTTDTHGQGSDT